MKAPRAIERKIRAYNPWPGAFTELGGGNLKIFAVSIVDLRGKPGEILRKEIGNLLLRRPIALYR